MKNSNPSILWIVFGLIFVLNLFQSFITELLPDEAYYWVYSQYLDWGYFDHPPMVAFLIKISSLLFDNELGVRFVSGIVLILTAFITWKTVYHSKGNNVYLFIALFFSMPLLNAYGFITTPDTGLVMFTSLLLYGYKSFLDKKALWNYVVLSIATAGMLYSKYQAVLVILCIVLSNPKILKDGKLWLAGLFTFLLFLPHILWQIENDFPSIRYHLYERVANRRYKFEHTLMHFVNMIAIIGLTFPLIYKAFYQQLKTKNLFFKALVYIVFGFFGLFFFSSFRGRVQAQWLVPITFSLIILSYHYFLDQTQSKKWLYRLAAANFLVLLIARAAFAFPGILPVKLDTHNNKNWVTSLQKEYKNTPKFFVNSYQNVATYWFYSREKAYYYQNFTGRKNHFTLLQKEQNLHFEKVLFANRGRTRSNEIAFKGVGKDSIYLSLMNQFLDPSKLKFEWSKEDATFALNKNNVIHGLLSSYENENIDISNFKFEIGFRHKKQRGTLTIPTEIMINQKSSNKTNGMHVSMNFQIPDSIHLNDYNAFGVGIKSIKDIEIFRISELRLFTFTR